MFGSLKIWQKLVVAGLMAAIPVGTLLYLFLNAQNEQIARTEAEREGLEYVQPLRSLLERVPHHRVAASAYLNGDTSVAPVLERTQKQIEEAMEAVGRVDARLGRKLGTTAPWETIRASWNDLRGAYGKLSPEDSYQRHTQLVALILQHIRLVGDKTGLTTDPELDTFYLVDSVLQQIPSTVEYLGQLASHGSAVAARQSMSTAEEAQIRYLVRQVSSSLESLQRNYRAAFSYNEELRENLDDTLATALNSAGFLRNLTQRELLDRGSIEVQPLSYIENGSLAVQKLFALHDATAGQVRRLFDARLKRLAAHKNSQLQTALLLLAMSALFVFLIQRGITRQIRSMRETFEQIRVGNYDARAEVYSRDELGMMAQSTNEMLANTLSLIQSREERDRIQQSILKLLDDVSGVAAGDLTKEAEVTAEMTGAIADAFNYMLGELRTIIGAVQDTTARVNSSAFQVREVTESLAESSQTQSQRVLAASNALQAMAQSIRKVAEQANAAAKVAEDALAAALAGGDSVRRTVAGMDNIRRHVQETARRMKRLGESSQEIGEIVQLISDISDRTSILALNASIQAAAAGESGKGFAIVAEEVERLAERATEATRRITVLIQSVQTETNEAISAMEATTREVVEGSAVASEAGERLSLIETVSQHISDLVRGISEVARRQAESSEQVASTVAEVSHATQTTASGALQAAENIRRLASMVNSLNESLSRFRVPGHEARPELEAARVETA
ncbi:MAG: methyl-accepting chemotaxis protein [Acidobacteriota bacterium]